MMARESVMLHAHAWQLCQPGNPQRSSTLAAVTVLLWALALQTVEGRLPAP